VAVSVSDVINFGLEIVIITSFVVVARVCSEVVDLGCCFWVLVLFLWHSFAGVKYG